MRHLYHLLLFPAILAVLSLLAAFGLAIAGAATQYDVLMDLAEVLGFGGFMAAVLGGVGVVVWLGIHEKIDHEDERVEKRVQRELERAERNRRSSIAYLERELGIDL